MFNAQRKTLILFKICLLFSQFGEQELASHLIFQIFLPILRSISCAVLISILLNCCLLFCSHFPNILLWTPLNALSYWLQIKFINLWWQLYQFIRLLKKNVSKWNLSLLSNFPRTDWPLNISNRTNFLWMQENFIRNSIKNYDRDGESLPKMIVTFSSCNGFLWTDFLKISFAHIGFVLKMCVSKGTRAYLHRKRKRRRRRSRKSREKYKMKHTKIWLVFASDAHTHTHLNPREYEFSSRNAAGVTHVDLWCLPVYTKRKYDYTAKQIVWKKMRKILEY